VLLAVDRGEVWLERRPKDALAYRRVGRRPIRATSTLERLRRMGLVELVGEPARVRPDNEFLTTQSYGLTAAGRAALPGGGAR
jgi:hypothetical protein